MSTEQERLTVRRLDNGECTIDSDLAGELLRLTDTEARAVVQALAANLGMVVVDPYHAVSVGDDAA